MIKIQNDKNPKKEIPEEYVFENIYFPEDENENIEQNSGNESIPFICTKCPHQFKDKQSLKHTLLIHTQEQGFAHSVHKPLREYQITKGM